MERIWGSTAMRSRSVSSGYVTCRGKTATQLDAWPAAFQRPWVDGLKGAGPLPCGTCVRCKPARQTACWAGRQGSPFWGICAGHGPDWQRA